MTNGSDSNCPENGGIKKHEPMEEILKFNSTTLKAIQKDGEMYSLNDLWRMLDSPSGRDPRHWSSLVETVRYLESECKGLNVGKSDIIKSKKGKGGGTYATQRVFLEYARYLNKDLAVQINEVFLQEIKAQQNPDLYIDKYRSAYKRKGKADDWIDKRMKSIGTRNELTHTLSQHGVKTSEGFRRCTNASYEGLLGCKAPALREALGITKKQSIRDNMSKTQLTALELSEDLAKQRIESRNLRGVEPCASTCKDAASAISKAIQDFLK